jgi:cytochrome c oxidase cbb3-type subunit 3
MSTQKDPLLMDHEADGIRELDNRLPAWWVWLFWGAILWGVGYLIHFHVFRMGPGSAEEYRQEMAAAGAAKSADAAAATAVAAASPAEAEVPLDQVQPSSEAAILAQGEALFVKNCVVCHAALGQGLIGPNLTDDFWIHGGEYKNIINTIREGVPAKGMITWKTVLKPSEILAVGSYVWSIHGRDVSKAVPPPKPTEPEAKEFKRPG